MSTPETRTTPDAEFQALVRSKYAGNPQAMTALGARLIVGRKAPFSPVDGEALIVEAAQQGDAAAWGYIAVLAATGVGRAQSWPDAFNALNRAVELGDAKAKKQTQLLHDLGLRGAADMDAWLAVTNGQMLHEAPRFVTYDGFLAPAMCAYLIECATPNLIQAQVYDARIGGLKIDAMRTNKGAAFALIDTDLVMQLIRARIARTAEVAFQALEPPEILHYSVGEQYKPHFDFFHSSLPNFDEEMRLKGQRIKTCLVYLNDGFDGGATEFPRLGKQFRGRAGEALIFENVGPNGNGDPNTVHAGVAPTRGEKWLLSQWIRNKLQPVA